MAPVEAIAFTTSRFQVGFRKQEGREFAKKEEGRKFLSCPKLAERFGHARVAETPFPATRGIDTAVSGALEETEFRLKRDSQSAPLTLGTGREGEGFEKRRAQVG